MALRLLKLCQWKKDGRGFNVTLLNQIERGEHLQILMHVTGSARHVMEPIKKSQSLR